MVRKAALLAYRHVIRDTEYEDALAGEIGRQPREADFVDREAYLRRRPFATTWTS